jgi:DNA-directed RNA polymerase specialized sigma24 family protein
MDEQQFTQLSNKMDTIIKLLALNAVEGKQLKDQVAILSSFGFQPKQIAEMLGKNPSSIRVMLHRLREERGEPETEEMTEEAGRAEDEQHA